MDENNELYFLIRFSMNRKLTIYNRVYDQLVAFSMILNLKKTILRIDIKGIIMGAYY